MIDAQLIDGDTYMAGVFTAKICSTNRLSSTRENMVEKAFRKLNFFFTFIPCFVLKDERLDRECKFYLAGLIFHAGWSKNDAN